MIPISCKSKWNPICFRSSQMYQIQAWFLFISYNWTDNLDISLFALQPYYHKMALFNIRNRNQIANTSYPKAVKSLFIIGVQMFVYGNLLGLVLLCLMLVQHKQKLKSLKSVRTEIEKWQKWCLLKLAQCCVGVSLKSIDFFQAW